MSNQAPRVLVVSRSVITPAHHGGCAYPAGLVAQLAEAGWEVHLLWLGGLGRLTPSLDWVPPGVARVHVPAMRVAGGRAWPARLADWWRARRGHAVDWQAVCGAVGRRVQPRAWLVNHTHAAGLLRARGNAEGWLLTHDILHQRATSYRRLGLEPDFPVMEEAQERTAWATADCLLAIAPDDAAVLRASGRPVWLVPPAPPAAAATTSATRPTATATPGEPGRVLFVGSANAANRDAATWLLHDIWPEIRRRVPRATLDIAGYVGRDLLRPLPDGVTCLDHVADLAALHARAAVVVVPMRAGSGLKLKLWEALHFGRPVVATPEGASGWPEWRTDVLAVEEYAAGFAQAVARLLQDPAAWADARARQDAWLTGLPRNPDWPPRVSPV